MRHALGALVAAALTLYAGRNNRSLALVLVFVLWVVTPFAGMAWARAPAATLAITGVSLAIYAAVAFGLVHAKIGFVFLVVPAVSWVAIVVARQWSRRASA